MTGKKILTVGISDNDSNQKLIDRSTNSFLCDAHIFASSSNISNGSG